MLRKCAVVYQVKFTLQLESWDLIANHFLGFWCNLVSQIPDFLHPGLQLCWKRLVILIYCFVICFGHGSELPYAGDVVVGLTLI